MYSPVGNNAHEVIGCSCWSFIICASLNFLRVPSGPQQLASLLTQLLGNWLISLNAKIALSVEAEESNISTCLHVSME